MGRKFGAGVSETARQKKDLLLKRLSSKLVVLMALISANRLSELQAGFAIISRMVFYLNWLHSLRRDDWELP